jgi:hypothetical protein
MSLTGIGESTVETSPEWGRVSISVEAESIKEGVHLIAQLAAQYQVMTEEELRAIAVGSALRGETILHQLRRSPLPR